MFDRITRINASAREASKSELERMEDVAYTLNHAIACTATDFIDPFVANATQKYLGRRFSVGCGHDHGHFHGPDDHSHGHDHHDHDHDHGHLGHWWLGELVGDIASVPVTIAAQRHAPQLMHGMRKGFEALSGGIFRRTAERAARRELTAFGMEADEEAVKARTQDLYEHEMEHLPQAAVWTASSIAFNVGIQKLTGNHAPLSHLLASKLVGVSFSTGLTVGLRALMPAGAQKWDTFASEKFYLPATKKVGKLFGVDAQTVDKLAEKQKAEKDWVSRYQAEKDQPKPLERGV